MQCDPIIATQYVEKVVPLIQEAKHTLDICVFDWRWYPNDVGAACSLFNRSIVDAIHRGVTVRALVNSENIAGTLRAAGAQVKKFVSAHLLHCKMIVIDDKIIVTGSHNFSQSAFQANYELSVILSDGVDTSEFNNFFKSLWQSQ